MNSGEFDIDCLDAAEKEPLLKGHPGNARRKASLDRMRARLGPAKGTGHPRVMGLLDCMQPDSALAAWGMLAHKLEATDPSLAQLAASEHALACMEAWGAMRTGADMIPHLAAMCQNFDERRHDVFGDMREELSAALSYLGDSVGPGPEVHAYIVNLARFGSRADDEMTRVLVDEIYIRRDQLEGACDICEEVLGFGGPDRDRMAGSTLVEDVLLMVLGGLEDRDRGERSLARRCGELLQARSDMLGLGIRPNPDDNNRLRPLAEFAYNISARRRIYPATELGRHIGETYPLSFKFLELDIAANLEEMVKCASPLAANMSAYVSLQQIAAAQKLPPGGSNALMFLEPMLAHLEGAPPCASVLKKWRCGIRGSQLWECLFEMEMYLRLLMAGANATVDKKVNGKVVDLEFDGCYAEIYSPLESEVLVTGHVVTVKDPGTHFIKQILSKDQLKSVGDHETVLIVECPPGMYTNVAHLGEKMRGLLGQCDQPGGVFFVRRDSSARRNCVFLENPDAATPVSGRAKNTLKRALALDLPLALS